MPEHRALGLAQDETIVRDHDPRWAAAYDAEATRLRLALDETPVVVEHIGSTAVPGLAAKPILDIAAGYSDLTKMNLIHTRIESLDYVFHGDQGNEGGMLFIKGPESSRTHTSTGSRSIPLSGATTSDFETRFERALSFGGPMQP